MMENMAWCGLNTDKNEQRKGCYIVDICLAVNVVNETIEPNSKCSTALQLDNGEAEFFSSEV